VQKTGENEFHILANALPVKTGEQRGGRSAIKTFVVEKYPNFQIRPFQDLMTGKAFNLTGAKLIGMPLRDGVCQVAKGQ
jgi:hypothetical protein